MAYLQIEETKAQRGKVTHPRSCSYEAVGLVFTPGSSGSRGEGLNHWTMLLLDVLQG